MSVKPSSADSTVDVYNNALGKYFPRIKTAEVKHTFCSGYVFKTT